MDKKDIPDQDDQEAEDRAGGKQGKRFDLSLAQVLGSAVAAVIAAFLAGQLGVYGTFLGAGVVSLVATSGGPIFQHFFSRTGEQIKEVAVPPKAARTRRLPVSDPVAGDWKDESGLDATQAFPASGTTGGAASDARHTQATRLIPAASPEPDGTPREPGEDVPSDEGEQAEGRAPDQVQMLDTAMVTRMLPGARGAEGEAADDATRVLRTAGPGSSHGAEVPAEKLPGDGEFTGPTTHGTRWRGWKRTLLPALVVFVIAIAGVTLYEVAAGHNVSGGKGTSISDVFRTGSTSGGGQDTTPSDQETGQQDGDGSDGDHDGTGDQPSGTPETGHEDREGGNGTEGSSDPSAPAETGKPQQPGQPDGSGKPDRTPAPGESGAGEGQDGTGTGDGDAQNPGGAGSGQLPQRQQPEQTPAQ